MEQTHEENSECMVKIMIFGVSDPTTVCWRIHSSADGISWQFVKDSYGLPASYLHYSDAIHAAKKVGKVCHHGVSS